MRAGTKFSDAVARTAWPIELHDRADSYIWEPFADDHMHYVPFGSLVPAEADNIVAAGRCIDGDTAALSTVRVMGPCIAMGAAAAHALDLAGGGPWVHPGRALLRRAPALSCEVFSRARRPRLAFSLDPPTAFRRKLTDPQDEGTLQDDAGRGAGGERGDGDDSVGWHRDSDYAHGGQPDIASVSFGGTRTFQLRHKKRKELKASVELTHGSLLIMRGGTQANWLHQIPKTPKPVEERLNLTFRAIVAPAK